MNEMNEMDHVPRIFLPCPCCGEAEDNVSLRMGVGDFECSACEDVFRVNDVRKLIAGAERWKAVLEWAAAIPGEAPRCEPRGAASGDGMAAETMRRLRSAVMAAVAYCDESDLDDIDFGHGFQGTLEVLRAALEGRDP